MLLGFSGECWGQFQIFGGTGPALDLMQSKNWGQFAESFNKVNADLIGPNGKEAKMDFAPALGASWLVGYGMGYKEGFLFEQSSGQLRSDRSMRVKYGNGDERRFQIQQNEWLNYVTMGGSGEVMSIGAHLGLHMQTTRIFSKFRFNDPDQSYTYVGHNLDGIYESFRLNWSLGGMASVAVIKNLRLVAMADYMMPRPKNRTFAPTYSSPASDGVTRGNYSEWPQDYFKQVSRTDPYVFSDNGMAQDWKGLRLMFQAQVIIWGDADF